MQLEIEKVDGTTSIIVRDNAGNKHYIVQRQNDPDAESALINWLYSEVRRLKGHYGPKTMEAINGN